MRMVVPDAPALRLVRTASRGGVRVLVAGQPGPRGEQGREGPVGPAATLDDIPDLVVFFENKLI